MNHYALQLYDYHVWANNRFFGRLKELPREVYHQEIRSVFPSIADTIVHMYMTDTIWLGAIREDHWDQIQDSLARAQVETKGKSLEEMASLFHELSEQYETFLNCVEDLDQPMAPEHPEFGRLETRLSELVQHVVNHGTYHRGNITAMIRQHGYASVPTDYVFYLYDTSSAK